MAFCSKCGKPLPDGAAFCGSCGARIPQDSGAGGSGSIPTFTPPGQSAPGQFTPIDIPSGPPGKAAPGPNVPVFTPPSQDIPVFTPPKDTIPTFRAPGFDGAVCFHHPQEPAVAKCARCGKYICKDCSEAYGVTAGEYAGKCLCFDCCEELVAQNVQELTQNKQKIKTQFTISIVGMVIGFLLGFIGGLSGGGFFVGLFGGLFYACVGGVFLSTMKIYFVSIWEAIKLCFSGEGGWIAALFFLFIQAFVIAFKCIVGTVSNTIFYINYLKKTSGFIEEDSAALQQMRDYMEYTLVRSQNKGVDLDSLMKQGSQLYNNSYAQAVLTSGEQAADAALRQATTRIAENGEIIRDFRAA